jgi:NhaP-type Na+/H+ or K+/H+ antiporter
MSTLDQEVDNSLRELERQRKAKLTLAIAAVVVTAGGLFALTSLMYSSTPGQIDADRIGEEAFR